MFVLLFQLCSETVGLPNAAGVEDVEVTGHFCFVWVFFPFSPEHAAWEPLRRAAVLTAVRCKSVIILSAREKTRLDDSSPNLAGKQLPAPGFHWQISDTILTTTPKPGSGPCLKGPVQNSWRIPNRPTPPMLQHSNRKQRWRHAVGVPDLG